MCGRIRGQAGVGIRGEGPITQFYELKVAQNYSHSTDKTDDVRLIMYHFNIATITDKARLRAWGNVFLGDE